MFYHTVKNIDFYSNKSIANFLKAKGLKRKNIPRDDESLYCLLGKNLLKNEIIEAIKKCDGKCPKNASKKTCENILVRTLLQESESSDTSSVASEGTDDSSSNHSKIEKDFSQSKIKKETTTKIVEKSNHNLRTPTRKRSHTIISPDTEEMTPSKQKMKHSLAKIPDTLPDDLFKLEDFKMKSKTIANVMTTEKGEKTIYVRRTHFAVFDNIVKYAIMIDVEQNGTTVWGYKPDVMQILYHTLAEFHASIGFLKCLESFPFVSPEDPTKISCDNKGYGRSFVGGIIEFHGTSVEAQANFERMAKIILDIHKRKDFSSIYLQSLESSGSSDKFQSFIQKNFDNKTGIGDLAKLQLHVEIDIPLNSHYLQTDVNRFMEDIYGSIVVIEEEWTEEQKLLLFGK